MVAGVNHKANPPKVRTTKFYPARSAADIHEFEPHDSTDLVLGAIMTINIPDGVNALLAQALDQNIRYVLAGTPSPTSGFRLTSGNDPLAIPVMAGMAVSFVAEAAGARLEMQFGVM